MTENVYDDAYASFACSPTARHLFGAVLDAGLPADLEPYSFVTSDLLQSARATLLDVNPGLLIDLGCGRGGPGLWLARELGCGLIGVDQSRVAVVEAMSRRNLFRSPRSHRSFVQGDLGALPLRPASVDAVVCIDALQTLEAPALTLGEVSRVLRPGGRFVATTWQAVDLNNERLAPRLRLDFQRLACAAGLGPVRITEMPDAHKAEIRLAHAAVALDPRLVDQELILQRVVSEAAETLAQAELTRRVILVADAIPDGSPYEA